jgi:hypothetical protein
LTVDAISSGDDFTWSGWPDCRQKQIEIQH